MPEMDVFLNNSYSMAMVAKMPQAISTAMHNLLACVQEQPSPAPPVSLPVSFQPGQLESLAAWIQSAAMAQNATAEPSEGMPTDAAAGPTASPPTPLPAAHVNVSCNEHAADAPPNPVNLPRKAIQPHRAQQQPSPSMGHSQQPRTISPHTERHPMQQDPGAVPRSQEARGKGSEAWAQPALAAAGKPPASSWSLRPSLPHSGAGASSREFDPAHSQSSSRQAQQGEQLAEPTQSSPPQLSQGEKVTPAWHPPVPANPAATDHSSAAGSSSLQAGWLGPHPVARQRAPWVPFSWQPPSKPTVGLWQSTAAYTTAGLGCSLGRPLAATCSSSPTSY